jgi:hypothetical protein
MGSSQGTDINFYSTTVEALYKPFNCVGTTVNAAMTVPKNHETPQ